MIGYYVHHHGNGHRARASALARATAETSGEPVVALSSLTEPDDHPFAGWLELPPDNHIESAQDPQAGGALHWAPLNSTGFRSRMQTLVDWAARQRPRVVVVDVSVEVAAVLRLVGVPVVVTAMPGDRRDDAHTLAYRLATAIVAPWPREIYDPAHLDAFTDKTSYVGAFSRFDDRPCSGIPRQGSVFALFGSGGGGPSAQMLDDIRRSTRREVVGYGGAELPWVDDVWRQLCAAEIVVTHAGMNALAEVAASACATIVLPQDRPFDEQRATARALADAGLVTAVDSWPEPSAWPALLDGAAARGGAGWHKWNDGAGARRFAQVLTELPTS